MIQILKSKDFFCGILRYALGLGMIPYALTKIFKTQFVLLPVGISQMPLEQIEGAKLAWAFLGYSAWFQVMLGFLELIPALLLLFRKTALMGALLMLPLTLNVCLINFALDLWVDTQLISSVFLLLNLLILIFYWTNLKSISQIILPKKHFLRFGKIEITANLILLLIVMSGSLNLLRTYIQDTNELTGDWYHQRPYEWKLIQKELNGEPQPMATKTIYFGAYGTYGTLDSGGKLSHDYLYKLDKSTDKLELTNISDSSKINYNYVFKNDTVLMLTQTNSTGNQVIETYNRRTIKTGKK